MSTSDTSGSTRDRIIVYLTEHSGVTAKDIAEATGLAKSTVNKALAQLERDELVSRTKGARTRHGSAPDTWSLRVEEETMHADEDELDVGAPTAIPSKKPFASGELLALVRQYFLDHPGIDVTAGEVARAIGAALNRTVSAGAVQNNLDKLENSLIVQTCEKPRRYRTLVST